MKRDKDAGREYAEIWGEAVQANRKLRTILIFLSASCVLGVLVLLRIAGAEPPKPIVVRVDEVGRAEALAYEAATAQADPLDPTTKYFLNRFVNDFHSRRRVTAQEQWTRSLRFLSTELANAAFARDGDEVASVAAGTAETERQVERSCSASTPRPSRRTAPRPTSSSCISRADRRSCASAGPPRSGSSSSTRSLRNSSSTTPWASSSPTSRPTGRW